MQLAEQVYKDRRMALDPNVWRDKTYVVNIAMNDSPVTIVDGSIAIDNMPFILDFITWDMRLNTPGPTLPDTVELRFSGRNVFYNPKFADARLLYGTTQNGGKVIPLVERLLFYPGERLRMEARNSEGGAPCILFDYTLEILFQGFERWR